ncbi:MAG: long-chain acyl-CoA synthetase [Solirubrobacteraceae bacterium]|nr:long-chain acyl-CoA synthetase [Solirubrobacteraceae bacterium]
MSGDAAVDTTFPRLLCQLAAQRPAAHALREKRLGIWQPITWAQYEQRVRHVAQGLATLGFERGETLAILGDNRPEWLIAELAAQSLGGSALGLHPDAGVEELARLLAQAHVRFVVVEGQEQVDKLVELERRGAIDAVEHVVYYDARGLGGYGQPYLSAFADVERWGSRWEPGWFEAQVRQGRATDVAFVCPTAGTAREPKLVSLTHANLLWTAAGLLSDDPIAAGDECFSFLPLAWVGEQVIALACSLRSALTLNFPESAATVQSDLREIGPRVLLCPPRIWESMLGQVQVRIGDSGWLKRRAFDWGIAIGRRDAAARSHDGDVARPRWLQLALARFVALHPVREQLGLTRIRRAYSGGAPLDPEVAGFFRAIGVNLKQFYGQTESCAIAVVQRDGEIRPQCVGTPLPGTELRIAADGEILLRSPAVFARYHRGEPPTTGTLRDGWLHTGDAGHVDDDGQLVVVDRMADIVHAPDGTRFGPTLVERKLRLSPHVAEAIALSGGARPYVTAMMSIDAGNVGAWAQHGHLGFSTYAELAQRPEVYELVAEHVARVNRDLPAAARVRRFVLLHRPLDGDDGRELTHTRTLRRAIVDERYADVVAALYADASHVTVALAATGANGAPPAAANGARPAAANGAPEAANGARPEAAITLAIRSMDGAGPAAAPAARTRQVARSA